MNSKTIRYVVRFNGHVQGVGFRATTLALAGGLPIDGFVKNEQDGSVLLDADGREGDLKVLLGRIESAMSGKIDGVMLDKRASQNRSDGFHIRA